MVGETRFADSERMTEQTTPIPPAPTPPPEGPKRLLRSADDRVLGGVAGGLGRYLGVDPLLIRIAFAVLTFIGFVGPVAYLGLMLAPDEKNAGASLSHRVAVMALFAFLAVAGLGALVVGLAGAAWATAAGGGAWVAGAIVVLGAVGVLAALRGRALAWLAPVAVLLAIPACVVAAADVSLDGGVGEKHPRPIEVGDIPRDGYELGVGELEIDLRQLRWPRSGVLELKTDMGIGETRVLVPEDVCVMAETHVGAGHVDVLGDDSDGADLDFRAGPGDSRAAKRLVLDSHLGMGALNVRHSDEAGGPNPCQGEA
jgi:phage shock protein PspC (stress-responsive transcriptional regulator)